MRLNEAGTAPSAVGADALVAARLDSSVETKRSLSRLASPRRASRRVVVALEVVVEPAHALDIIADELHSHLTMNDAARRDLMFSALSDPTRRAILARLAEGDATVA